MESPSSSPSPSGQHASQGIVGPILIALLQTSLIILLGYLSMVLNIISYVELRGIKKFCGNVALPAIFFVEVSNVNWGTVEFGILGGMFSAKVITFLATAAYVWIRSSWNKNDHNLLSTLGIFCIFATKSNDIALGVPLIDAAFSNNHTTKFSKYLYLFAPFQLLILNVTGFIFLELGRQKTDAAAAAAASVATAVAGAHNVGSGVLAPVGSPTRSLSSVTTTTTTTTTTTSSSGRRSYSYSNSPTKTGVPTAPTPSPPQSVCSLLPRILWNVTTTPAVSSVILGLITNIVLYSALTTDEINSRPTLLPTPINAFFGTIGKGYAVTALFSIGAGMHGCFGRTKFGKKEIVDGIMLIFMKTIFMAFVTNRCISLFMGDHEGTALFDDSADFGWLYGMIPVAPTVYMFAELYNVHTDFMALFANLCSFVAGPLLVMAAASLEATKGMTTKESIHLHDVIADGMSWVGMCLTIPMLLGMFGSRWFLRFPCDFMVVMLIAYVGYSATTVACIATGNGHEMPSMAMPSLAPSLVASLGPSPSSSGPKPLNNIVYAFAAFFFETFYQTHTATMAFYMGWKSHPKRAASRNKTNNATCGKDCGMRSRLHVGSLVLSLSITAVVYSLYDGARAPSSRLPQPLMSRFCAIEFVDNGNMRTVTALYQLCTFVVACCSLYTFHVQRRNKRTKKPLNKKNRVFNTLDSSSTLLNNVIGRQNSSASKRESSIRNMSHVGLCPPQWEQQQQQQQPPPLSPLCPLAIDTPIQDEATRPAQKKRSMDHGISPNTGAPRSSATRVLTIISIALVSTLIRGVTDSIYNFDIPSTKEISLVATVMTYSQGIFISGMYLLHPYVIANLYGALDCLLWTCQPKIEMDNLILEAEAAVAVPFEREAREEPTTVENPNVSATPTTGEGRPVEVGRETKQEPTLPTPYTSLLPTIRLEAFDEEEEFILNQNERASSMPVRSLSATMASAYRELSVRPFDPENARINAMTLSTRKTNVRVRSRLLTFRTRGGYL